MTFNFIMSINYDLIEEHQTSDLLLFTGIYTGGEHVKKVEEKKKC